MLDRGQRTDDAHTSCVPVNNFDRDQIAGEAQTSFVPVDDLGRGHQGRDAHSSAAPSFSYLLLCADSLDDAERMRIALENRLRALGAGKNHRDPGPSLADSRPYAHWQDQLAILVAFEHQAALELKRALRTTPYADFQKRTLGLGEKQFARLLAAIGDPYIKPEIVHDDGTVEPSRPRTVSDLRSYCGYGDAAEQKRRKGVQSNWNATAKMRAFLCAESCMKQRTSPYRDVYDKARMDWASRETTDGHKHNHALRLVAKTILRDLWLEGRGLATATATPATPKHPPLDPSNSSAQAILVSKSIARPPESDLAGVAA